MKSYTIRYHRAQHTVVAATPRKALWIAVQRRAINQSAWSWMKEHKTEGHYGPLSITQNHGSQLVFPEFLILPRNSTQVSPQQELFK